MATLEEGTVVEPKKELASEIETVIDSGEMIHVMTTGSSGTVTLPITLTQGGIVSLTSPSQAVSRFPLILSCLNNLSLHHPLPTLPYIHFLVFIYLIIFVIVLFHGFAFIFLTKYRTLVDHNNRLFLTKLHPFNILTH